MSEGQRTYSLYNFIIPIKSVVYCLDNFGMKEEEEQY